MFSSINTCWTLVGAFLVYFMQAGFALCEAGFTRAKNTGNILMKNMMDFETLLFSYIQNNKKSQSAKNDQCTCGQIQKDIILIRRQVSK